MKNNKITTVELRKLIRESVQEVMDDPTRGLGDVGDDPIEAIKEAVELLKAALFELERARGEMGE